MNEQDLAATLRQAVELAGDNWRAQPSILKRRLNDILASEATPLRAKVHLLVVAAEEKVPTRLGASGSDPERHREIAAELAATRGWTDAAALWAITTWAAAMGLTPLSVAEPAVIEPPVGTPSEPIRWSDDTALPESAVIEPHVGARSDPNWWSDNTALPEPAAAESTPALWQPTILPTPAMTPTPGPLPVRPLQAFAPPQPVAMQPPPADAPPPAMQQPPAYSPPPAMQPPPAYTPPKPLIVPVKVSQKAVPIKRRVERFLGEPVDAVYGGYTGLGPALHLVLFGILVVVSTIAIVGLFTAEPKTARLLLITQGVIAIAVGLTRRLSPIRWVAVQGTQVRSIVVRHGWILDRLKPVGIAFEGPLSAVRPVNGSTRSVLLGDERVYFIPPFTQAAAILTSGQS